MEKQQPEEGLAATLRRRYGDPMPLAAAKVIDRLDVHCRTFIDHSPLVMLATSNGHTLDVSPKGGDPGFIKVENDQTLLMPDYAGNNRIDGLINIAAEPQVALVFFIPGVKETLRVNGPAEVVLEFDTDPYPDLWDSVPKSVLRVRTREVMLHCGAALQHASVWQPETWPRERPIASLSRIVRDHAAIT
ncbi:MAG: MSMEG_1061 family FMN-dependent PPOX-type flavoprotein [Pseudomonadota bacterium]